MGEPTAVERDAGEQLWHLMPRLRRAIVVAVRAAERLPSLPEAQVFVLRTLVTLGPLTPARLAAELHLARPTVSNLVKDLVAAELLERHPAPDDRRSVLLVPTERAKSVLTTFAAGRDEVLSRALSEVSQKDRASLVAALPAMRHLMERLQAMTTDDEVSP
ncbi:MarR family winged helix-turn-helix transcriptional regulator [Amycolatopsis sp. NPDC098790]|uniref:MarR family winged helix-turn-helix transcriptional regulator n=1 Tax=Amycolatopsis sp. NPDC098790 TaxID=3363939 RepID=UPI003829A7E8